MNPIVELEYNNIHQYILHKYSIDIAKNEYLDDYIVQCIELFSALKIWSKHFEEDIQFFEGARYYFNEIISNVIHATILATLDLKIPTLIMLRRSQENLLTSLYYSEHNVEYYKKELDGNSRNFNGFKELKDYVTTYPFSSRYCINSQITREFCVDIIRKWTEQYQELSNYVHGTNTKYFLQMEYFDKVVLKKDDFKYLSIQIQKLGSVINTLLILFFFNMYRGFSDETEKNIIRQCIKNEYEFKERIHNIFKEI